ncbi:MAG: NAD-dependent dihydropyrimidine dehydrogenase subunit PreA [Kofleriaceae bacterium]|nr:NAD-dependent dihydropyrimidine dehydrogenase subunit PreA [Myxococcales bacterium]MCB9560264.1 NAD-dependent dihydropyrimidine dehydrogenase subunit PreA [Kofleriaceae bacterium]
MTIDLSITVNGMRFDNPFVLGSGPPGTNGKVIAKSFDLGWGGMVCKTISLDSSKVINTVPRYAKLKARGHDEVIGFENIELISDRPFADWLDDLRQLKQQYPHKILIASIMEEYRKEAWQDIVRQVQETGVDAFELNLSCPHGLPERKMGMAMGENPDIVEEVVGWSKEVAKVPVWAKMTPNVGNPTVPAGAALKAGADGIAMINTILSVCGVDLKTLRPMPTVEGYSVPGGYSGQAVRPIALRQVMEVARANPGVEISGIGGIETGRDAAQFFLLGASTVQICTGAMLRGYEMIDELKADLSGFMSEHGFTNLREFIGKSLPFFSTHHDLGDRQKAAREAKESARAKARGRDAETWKGDIAKETTDLVTK